MRALRSVRPKVLIIRNDSARLPGHGFDPAEPIGEIASRCHRARTGSWGKDKVRAAYHRGTHWKERVEMAQWWSDYLDQIRKGGDIVQFPKRGTV